MSDIKSEEKVFSKSEVKDLLQRFCNGLLFSGGCDEEAVSDELDNAFKYIDKK